MLARQGRSRAKPRRPILDELIATVLSQATSDANSERAFTTLRKGFATWEAVRAAPVADVAAAIRSGGIGTVKARRIKQILDEIAQREGRLDLRRLARLTDGEVVDYLCSLPGVGPKTAACVLLFSMGRAAFPVDTHVARIAERLGLIEPGTGAGRAQELLQPVVPPELRYEFHLQLIRHGRSICTSRAPFCSACPLFDLCATGPSLLARGQAK